MTAEERVLTAFRFQTPDRVPTFDSFWEFPDEWRKVWDDPGVLTDIHRFVPEERAFPTRTKRLKEEDGWITEVDGWGRTIRHKPGTYYVETLQLPFKEDQDPDSAEFDPPELDSRYYGTGSQDDLDKKISDLRSRFYVFVKTGGPFLRTTYVRGETEFLMDMAADPSRARAWADKVAHHIAAVGVEALARTGLQENGIWIYDDMGTNKGPFFSPEAFEKVLLPGFRHMIKAYREAGARHVLLHSDGDIRVVLDMLIDAGIEGLNPLEKRAGMDIVEIRKKYPDLILTGGMDNTDTLINGPVDRIKKEAQEIIDLGRNGGIVIGTHSISPEISLENFRAYRSVCENYGRNFD